LSWWNSTGDVWYHAERERDKPLVGALCAGFVVLVQLPAWDENAPDADRDQVQLICDTLRLSNKRSLSLAPGQRRSV
jgi:hypothetical protein